MQFIQPIIQQTTRSSISGHAFKTICFKAKFNYSEILKLLTQSGYAHNGCKYWTLQNYIDLAHGMIVKSCTWRTY